MKTKIIILLITVSFLAGCTASPVQQYNKDRAIGRKIDHSNDLDKQKFETAIKENLMMADAYERDGKPLTQAMKNARGLVVLRRTAQAEQLRAEKEYREQYRADLTKVVSELIEKEDEDAQAMTIHN
jgi:hypothetical protein